MQGGKGRLPVSHRPGYAGGSPREGRILFLVNMDGKGATIPLEGEWKDALTGKAVTAPVKLDPYGYAVLEKA